MSATIAVTTIPDIVLTQRSATRTMLSCGCLPISSLTCSSHVDWILIVILLRTEGPHTIIGTRTMCHDTRIRQGSRLAVRACDASSHRTRATGHLAALLNRFPKLSARHCFRSSLAIQRGVRREADVLTIAWLSFGLFSVRHGRLTVRDLERSAVVIATACSVACSQSSITSGRSFQGVEEPEPPCPGSP
ncbi:hypothetical protein BDV95DRAFT_93126 [Massariosphaeria phaeospora]|uniref:Uncharacterized protein n=1 Tax=Massariosphaeria phaeospora TaxID=100035 RepID=A0A7C8M828_9PLEO|nr:hypothetical protein BDV95DRAFT_93126 [Massariosphaeria phaeospora]